MKTQLIVIFFVFVATNCFAQESGKAVYSFLNLSLNTFQSSLGGVNISSKNHSSDIVLQNPAMLDSSYSKKIALNYNNFVSDINLGSISFAHNINNNLSSCYSLVYLNYGKFERYDNLGNQLGEFTGNEFALFYSLSYQIKNNFYAGANTKLIFSQLDNYHSFGIAFDLSAYYQKKLFSCAIMLKNIGSQLKTYNQTKEKLPFNLIIGVSKTLENAPFSINFSLQNLQEPQKEFYKHFVLGLEILKNKPFNFNIGYNFKRSNDMRIKQLAPFAGLCFGFNVTLKKFSFGYSRENYLKDGANMVGVRIRII